MRPRLRAAQERLGRTNVGETLSLLGYACGRVGAEFRDLSRQQHGADRTDFAMLVYLYPVQIRDRERLCRAFEAAAGAPLDDSGLPAAVPFLNGAFYCHMLAVSADAAAMSLLGVVREALQKCDMTVEKVRLEARPFL